MEKLIIKGGNPLKGSIKLAGTKNVAMKTLVAALLTDEKVIVRNVPLISSVTGTAQIVKPLNVNVHFAKDNMVSIDASHINNYSIPLELGGLYRTSTMVIGPLLSRFGKAVVPNPGGCRLGKRPIDRHIDGLKALGATIEYKNGFFHAHCKKLKGVKYKFLKNTHTGTETLLLAAVLSEGETVLENASSEPEVDDLINLLNSMGAKIERVSERVIKIKGVKKLKGTDYTIMPDRNEAVTFAIGAYVTGGDVFVKDIKPKNIRAFLNSLKESGANYDIQKGGIRFYRNNGYMPTDIVTGPSPQFMTDWQATWALFATLCKGISTIHETVFESRFAYVSELKKMGADIEYFDPVVSNPKEFYNFNWEDRNPDFHQGIKIKGPIKLHNAVVNIDDLRAGATLILAALAAQGESIVFGVEHVDRGYERFEQRLSGLGANIKRIKQ